jgi:hypothetical protein
VRGHTNKQQAPKTKTIKEFCLQAMLWMKKSVKNRCLGSMALYSLIYLLDLILLTITVTYHPQTYTVTCTLPTLHPSILQLPSADPQIEPYIDNLKDFLGYWVSVDLYLHEGMAYSLFVALRQTVSPTFKHVLTF